MASAISAFLDIGHGIAIQFGLNLHTDGSAAAGA
jgi:hypothetical protein